MQDIAGKADTELNSEDLTLSWRELSVESTGHCQSVGNWLGSKRIESAVAEEI
jgi:hypothetical protein